MGKINDDWYKIMSAPIPANEIDWMVKTTNVNDKKGRASILFICYFTARLAIARLNEAFGRYWSKELIFKEFMHDFERVPTNGPHKGQLTKVVQYCKCAITVRDDEGEFYREGLANSADIEPAKSAESNALKRAVGNFGVGAELYDYPKVHVEGKQSGTKWYPPSMKVMKPALDFIVELVSSGKLYEEAYFIKQDGSLYTYAYGWADKKVSIGAIKTTTLAKKAAPKKEEKQAEPKPPQILKWPVYSDKPNSAWQKAIDAWDGNIRFSEKLKKHIVTVEFKGNEIYYELGKAQYDLLVVHEKHGVWTSKEQVKKSQAKKDGESK